MREELDYSLLGRQPTIPDFWSNTGSTSPVSTEYLWPSGRKQYTLGVAEALTMTFREPGNADLWGVDTTAVTAKGTFHIQYDWRGHLHRVRVSLADMIISASTHAMFAKRELRSALSRRNLHDAQVTIFPKDHTTHVQHHGSFYDMGIVQYDDGIRTSIVMLPEFPDVMLNISYDSFFAIQPYFLLEKKSVVTYIPMQVDLPDSLYANGNTDAMHRVGAMIMGVLPRRM